jgi:pimeloyl-ACP methyl ester carboxylesterase
MNRNDKWSRRELNGIPATAVAAVAEQAVAQPAAPAAMPFYNAPEEPLPYRPFQVRGTDGTIIACQEWGNPRGFEIVFIHGILQSHLSFKRQVMSDLAKDFRMMTYDLRGHGDSDKPNGKEHYLDGALWADDLGAVIKGAGLRRPVLVGWSFGGQSMGSYLQKYGDVHLAGLNFVGALTKRSPEFAGYPQNRLFLPRTASPDLGTRVDAMRDFLRICFKAQPDEADFERMLAVEAQVPRYVMLAFLSGISLNADVAYTKVKVPVLITHGAEDGQISVKITEFDKEQMPHATLSIYEDVGHSPFYEAADRFNRELTAFVRAANV